MGGKQDVRRRHLRAALRRAPRRRRRHRAAARPAPPPPPHRLGRRRKGGALDAFLGTGADAIAARRRAHGDAFPNVQTLSAKRGCLYSRSEATGLQEAMTGRTSASFARGNGSAPSGVGPQCQFGAPPVHAGAAGGGRGDTRAAEPGPAGCWAAGTRRCASTTAKPMPRISSKVL
mmetsp:Transcript_47253/g.153363  ORF Transcript_47253/g.153363 Transcript_47253/m.153363 type:complete len:175 (-) Transcript_47253:177-701(-)